MDASSALNSGGNTVDRIEANDVPQLNGGRGVRVVGLVLLYCCMAQCHFLLVIEPVLIIWGLISHLDSVVCVKLSGRAIFEMLFNLDLQIFSR